MSLTPQPPADSLAPVPAPADPADRPLTRKELIALERAAAPAQIHDAPEAHAAPEPGPSPSGTPLPPAAPAGQAPEPAPAAQPQRPLTVRILRTVGTAVVLVVLCASLLVGAAAIAVPALGGGTALTVQTSSMEPHYPAGTMVVIRPVEAKDIAPGDVITYQRESGKEAVVTHRVTQQLRTAAGGYLFITQGDNNPSPDPNPVQEVQLRGKLWYAIPWIGHVSAAVTGQWRAWVIPLAVGALFTYAAWMFVSSARDKRHQRARREAS
ncbi:signal peptidase I [Galactobacter valiniphilus]|uniref:signal peptidase I n=1 Tax=Galactobacter valiniphilus TaxID=2676122 RepID=UPI0037369B7D